MPPKGRVPFARTVVELAPPPDFEESVQEALTAVQEAVAKVFGQQASVLTFGSLVQGVHLAGSDLDLCMDVPGVVETIGSNGKSDNSKQVAALRSLMRKFPKSFRIIEQRLFKHIKVPIVILGYTGSAGYEVETDISVGIVFDGVEKGFTDRIIRRVLARTPRALHAARLIKLWAKVEGLNKAYDGFLNSLGWTLLVVYFFLERGEITTDMLELEEDNERGLDDGLTLPPPLEAGSEDDVPTGEEIAEFFDMVVGFETFPEPEDAGGWCLSLVEGQMIMVPPVKKQYADQIDFFLEDPGIKMAVGRSENVARALKRGPWQTTMNKCRQAASNIRGNSDIAADNWVSALVRKASSSATAKAVAQWAPPQAAASQKRPWETPAWPQAKRARGNDWQSQQDIPDWQKRVAATVASAYLGAGNAGKAWGPTSSWQGGGGAGGGKRRGNPIGGGGGQALRPVGRQGGWGAAGAWKR